MSCKVIKVKVIAVTVANVAAVAVANVAVAIATEYEKVPPPIPLMFKVIITNRKRIAIAPE